MEEITVASRLFFCNNRGRKRKEECYMPKKRNCSVDIFRYVCAVMVVAIHTHPMQDIHPTLGYVFTQVLPRMGVPFFFAVAGYFYMQKLQSGQKCFWPYIKRLLITYGLWSVFYYGLDFVQFGYKDLGPFLINCVKRFVIFGSRGHFWFFPALIFSVCLATLMYKLKCRWLILPLGIVLYTVGCLGSGYYHLGKYAFGWLYRFSQYEVIRRVLLMGFPFFGCGLLVGRLKLGKMMPWVLPGAVALWLGEIILVNGLKLSSNIVLTPFLYILVVVVLAALLDHPAAKQEKLANISRVAANFTYYSHPFVILCLKLLPLTETPVFLSTLVICGGVSLIIYKLNNKYLNYLV